MKDKIYQKIVKLTVEDLSLNNEVDIELEYSYKDVTSGFHNTFEIKITNLHDFLFNYATIIFYKVNKNSRNIVGASKIRFQHLIKDNYVKINKHDILDKNDIDKADHYNAQWKKIGYFYVRFEVKNTPEILEEKKTENFINNFFTLAFSKNKSELFTKIIDLFKNMKQGSLWCNLKVVLGYLPADYYYNFLHGNCDNLECENELCEKEYCERTYKFISSHKAVELFYYMQEAAAPFADAFYMKYLAPIREREDIVNIKYKAILERLLINDGDLLAFFEGNEDIPGYIAYFKRKSEDEKPFALAISFRGTVTGNDALHDLECSYTEFQNGYVHGGFKRLTDNFFDQKWPGLLKIAEKKKIKQISLFGYSLGAAIAVLFHLRLQKATNYQIKTVTFACPPVVSEKIALRKDLNIESWAFGNDIVTRISYGSILDLKYFCISISSLILYINNASEMLKNINEIRNHIKTYNNNPKLYVPGKLYHVREFDTGIYKYKKVDHKFFEEIILCRSCGWDHFLNNLANAFDSNK
ncbi:hypothetical protein NUSPORA_00253 [Nucleospora cyclopteri]